MPRVGLTRRYRRGDVVYWRIAAGDGQWPTDGIGKVASVDHGVFRLHDGQIVTTDEIVELIADANHPRPHRLLAA